MKIIKYILTLTIITTLSSCKNGSAPKVANVQKGIQNIEVSIEGMTCEIGCAKLIESKVHKLAGVTSSEVDFENKVGKISYDSSKISKEEIVKTITGIAGGELYKVTDIKTIK